MSDSDTTNSLSRKFNRIKSELDERGCRLWAASEAMELGHGGIKAVAKATGLGERTVRRGCKDLRQEAGTLAGLVHRARNSGGGRKPLTVHDPKLVEALGLLVEPTARGDPMSPLRWTCKSTRKLAVALGAQGHPVSHTKVAQLLEDLGYSLQANRKTLEGKS